MLNIYLPYDPAIVLIGIDAREMKADMYRKFGTQMFIAALFLVTPIRKQPK